MFCSKWFEHILCKLVWYIRLVVSRGQSFFLLWCRYPIRLALTQYILQQEHCKKSISTSQVYMMAELYTVCSTFVWYFLFCTMNSVATVSSQTQEILSGCKRKKSFVVRNKICFIFFMLVPKKFPWQLGEDMNWMWVVNSEWVWDHCILI